MKATFDIGELAEGRSNILPEENHGDHEGL